MKLTMIIIIIQANTPLCFEFYTVDNANTAAVLTCSTATALAQFNTGPLNFVLTDLRKYASIIKIIEGSSAKRM
jgi:hypothetical protein